MHRPLREDEPRHRLRPRDAGPRHGLLLPGHRPRRVQVVQGVPVARPRRPRPLRRLGRLRAALVHSAATAGSRGSPSGRRRCATATCSWSTSTTSTPCTRSVIVRGDRPPDRRGRLLVQPERHRRRRQRRRHGPSSASAAGSTATSTNGSSTARSTAAAPSPAAPGGACDPSSPARSASTGPCCSARRPSAPSCS